MKSEEAKVALLDWMLFRAGFTAGFTEFQNADVFGITKAGYTHEVEVKVSKSDLMSELKCVECILGRAKQEKYMNKQFKHKYYLTSPLEKIWATVPNKFSFAVPKELVLIACEYLAGTKYGVIELTGGVPETRKKSDWLHKEKPNEKLISALLRKASTEVYFTREKILKLAN